MSSLTAAKVVDSRKSISYWVLKAGQLLQKDTKKMAKLRSRHGRKNMVKDILEDPQSEKCLHITVYKREQF